MLIFTDKLEENLASAIKIEDLYQRARFYANEVKPTLEKLREKVDKLEEKLLLMLGLFQVIMICYLIYNYKNEVFLLHFFYYFKNFIISSILTGLKLLASTPTSYLLKPFCKFS